MKEQIIFLIDYRDYSFFFCKKKGKKGIMRIKG